MKSCHAVLAILPYFSITLQHTDSCPMFKSRHTDTHYRKSKCLGMCRISTEFLGTEAACHIPIDSMSYRLGAIHLVDIHSFISHSIMNIYKQF